jgi:hypothetical protein
MFNHCAAATEDPAPPVCVEPRGRRPLTFEIGLSASPEGSRKRFDSSKKLACDASTEKGKGGEKRINRMTDIRDLL